MAERLKKDSGKELAEREFDVEFADPVRSRRRSGFVAKSSRFIPFPPVLVSLSADASSSSSSSFFSLTSRNRGRIPWPGSLCRLPPKVGVLEEELSGGGQTCLLIT